VGGGYVWSPAQLSWSQIQFLSYGELGANDRPFRAFRPSRQHPKISGVVGKAGKLPPQPADTRDGWRAFRLQ
jgi:hypothetical protein